MVEHEEKVVGHIAYSRARVDSGDEILALAPMAVLPEHQRQGFGTALVRESLRHATETEFPLVVVVGHPEYYPRFGFEPAAPLGIAVPFEVPSEALMAFRLPTYRPAVRGTVEYAAALSPA